MTATEQVKAALVDAIERGGVTALGAYSDEQLKKYQTAVAAVGVKEMRITHSGALEYLGEREDAVRGTVEVYGRRLELSLSLDVYAPRTLGAAGCETAADTITQVMMHTLPCGLHLQELTWAQVHWDKTYGMFHLGAQAKYEAYFTAETTEETVVFTDFILRGVVQNHD